MAEYDNELRGCLFRNGRKQKESQPEYRGQAQINGVPYWVSGWIKTAQQTGDKYMSLSFEAKKKAPPIAPPAQTAPEEEPF